MILASVSNGFAHLRLLLSWDAPLLGVGAAFCQRLPPGTREIRRTIPHTPLSLPYFIFVQKLMR